MSLKLYDLVLGESDIRPSPYCWIAKFALLHKGLDFETVPVGFADKENYPDAEYGKVPVLVDGEEMIKDSAAIAAWLDKHYPDKPLTRTSGEAASAEFYRGWMLAVFFPAVAPMLVARIHALAAEADKTYFRKTREQRFGKTLEELAAMPGHKEKAEAVLQLLSAPLGRYRFLGGDAPNLCDYNVMGCLMWPRLVCAQDLVEPPQPVAAWMERMLDLYDGYARQAKRAS